MTKNDNSNEEVEIAGGMPDFLDVEVVFFCVLLSQRLSRDLFLELEDGRNDADDGRRRRSSSCCVLFERVEERVEITHDFRAHRE